MTIMKMNPNLMFPIAIVGTFMLIHAYSASHLVERVKSRGIETKGTVIEIRQNSGSLFSVNEGKGEAPVVNFAAQNGTYIHYSTNYTTPCPYKVGQKVKIWYYFYKSRREIVLTDDNAGRLPQTLFCLGIVLCIISYPFLIKKLIARIAAIWSILL